MHLSRNLAILSPQVLMRHPDNSFRILAKYSAARPVRRVPPQAGPFGARESWTGQTAAALSRARVAHLKAAASGSFAPGPWSPRPAPATVPGPGRVRQALPGRREPGLLRHDVRHAPRLPPGDPGTGRPPPGGAGPCNPAGPRRRRPAGRPAGSPESRSNRSSAPASSPWSCRSDASRKRSSSTSGYSLASGAADRQGLGLLAHRFVSPRDRREQPGADRVVRRHQLQAAAQDRQGFGDATQSLIDLAEVVQRDRVVRPIGILPQEQAPGSVAASAPTSPGPGSRRGR